VTTWEPQTYLRYADIRFRAGLDLLARIPKLEYRTIYDLGCGTGHLTRILADTFPDAKVVGVDSSPEMLAEARREFPIIDWQQDDISSWNPAAPADLIYTNAALQWVPDHETLLPRLLNKLQPGGVLAMQVPRHFESPSHLALKELVMQGEWHAKLEPLLLTPVPPPETYWRWLSPHTRNLDLWETIYLQVLDGRDPVVNFMRDCAAPFPLRYARRRNSRIYRGLCQTNGRRLSSPIKRPNTFPVPSNVFSRTALVTRKIFMVLVREHHPATQNPPRMYLI
jgi:trans-aconitate 2-methyltransferase